MKASQSLALSRQKTPESSRYYPSLTSFAERENHHAPMVSLGEGCRRSAPHQASLLAPQPLLLALHRLQLGIDVEGRLTAEPQRPICMHHSPVSLMCHPGTNAPF